MLQNQIYLNKKLKTIMAVDKILNKLQLQIKDMLPTMELFLDDTIQPSVVDCGNLKQHLIILQEHLIIYNYRKLKKEISPSFNIHAKVSGVELESLEVTKEESLIVQDEKLKEVKIEEKKFETTTEIHLNTSPKNNQSKKLNIGLNDKFRFINELFKKSDEEYRAAHEQLASLTTWYESELYLNSLKDVYEWKDTADTVKHFYSINKKRFD